METGGVAIAQVIVASALLWIFVHPFTCKKVTRGQRFNWFCCSLFGGFLGYGLYYAFAVKWKRKKEPFTWSSNPDQWMRHQS